MKLSHHNFLYYGIYMILVITTIFAIDYSLIKNHLKSEAEEELIQRCENIHLRIQKSLNSAIENYLRGITESNLDIVNYYYKKFKDGDLTETEAKNAIQEHCNRQNIGTSGYFVSVENIDGRLILDIHPFKRHEDCSRETGCMVWDTVRNGYAEYDWKNPEDSIYRKKVAYLREFPEWNWVFGATSYKSEFTQLVNIQDLKNILSSEKIRGSGYAILYDNNKNLLFHPMLEKYKDESFLQEQSNIVERILSAPGEIIFYNWKNPEDNIPRKKYAYTQKIPEFDYYLVVSGYMNDIYSPLKRIIHITLVLSASAVLLLLLSVFFHSRKVVTPILKVIEGIKKYNKDRALFKIPETSVDEIKTLASSFQNMTKEIDKQIEEKQQTIAQIQQINKQLEIAKDKAEESDRLKSAFLANMSHEIRTPMNGILGFTNLLKDSKLTIKNQTKYIEIIEKSGERMMNTLNDIIDISKIEAGQVELSKSVVSINNILNEQFVFFNKEAEAKGIELLCKTELNNSELNFITDKQKLESILTNLIKNAIKFTHQGNVTFGYTLKQNKNEEVIEFYVKDTGIGIPKDRLGAIFNRFEKADIEDENVYEGSGLGLAITKSYIEMLGGSVDVSSEQGVGTIFSFSMPFSKIDSKDVTSKSDKINNEVSSKKLTVIVAEDDEVSRQLFTELFENKFQNIFYTKTGEETIETCRNNPAIDIIFMDIKMPGINGYMATHEIRKFNKEVVIIAQTAYGLVGDKEKALEAGCDDYITKPIKLKVLKELINKHINQRGRSMASQHQI